MEGLWAWQRGWRGVGPGAGAGVEEAREGCDVGGEGNRPRLVKSSPGALDPVGLCFPEPEPELEPAGVPIKLAFDPAPAGGVVGECAPDPDPDGLDRPGACPQLSACGTRGELVLLRVQPKSLPILVGWVDEAAERGAREESRGPKTSSVEGEGEGRGGAAEVSMGVGALERSEANDFLRRMKVIPGW